MQGKLLAEVMGKDDVKTLIWGLDAALGTFSGVDWMDKVGRVARLKEKYFCSIQLTRFTLRDLPVEELNRLQRSLDVLAHDGSSARVRGMAFDRAAELITLLLRDNQE